MSNSIPSTIAFFPHHLPFVFWSAVAFYLVIAALLLSDKPRKRFMAVFSAPVPTAGSSMAPMDSIRGIAALWVFLYHTWLFMQPFNARLANLDFTLRGQMAVPFFAVLSGLLVYRPIRQKDLNEGDIRAYFIRRFLRIYPLYLFTLLFGALTLKIISGGFGNEGLMGYASDIFMLRVFGFPDFCGAPPWNMPAWSLYCEALFYLVLPVFIILSRKRIMLISIIALILFSIVGIVGEPNEFIQLLKFFLIGIILCELFSTNKMDRIGGGLSFLSLAAGITLLAAACADRPLIDEAVRMLLPHHIPKAAAQLKVDFSISVAVSSALIFIGALKFRPITLLLSLYPLRFIGIISYSIYMLHIIIIRIATAGFHDPAHSEIGNIWTFIFLFLPMILLYSSLSYAVIERTFLKLRTTTKTNKTSL